MIVASELYNLFKKIGIDFFTGVPDSTLKNFLDYMVEREGYNNHIVASNEGNAVALASGYFMSNNKPALVYMQNSGIGNAVNPITSLTQIYNIPVIYLIGWRGMPGKKDEPQHQKMGEITLQMLDVLGIDKIVVENDSDINEIEEKYNNLIENIKLGKSVAFVITPGSIEKSNSMNYKNENDLIREDVIKQIIQVQDKKDIIVSTTGKTSRELFEIREFNNEEHNRDFLTVGSMGHASSIALGVAMNTENRIWCLDGDGAMLMHLGALTTIGSRSPKKFIHILINNEAHESVGGIATISPKVDWSQMSYSCGYKKYLLISKYEELFEKLTEAKNSEGPVFIEIKTQIGSRENLGRPTISPQDNIVNFIDFLNRSNNESNNI